MGTQPPHNGNAASTQWECSSSSRFFSWIKYHFPHLQPCSPDHPNPSPPVPPTVIYLHQIRSSLEMFLKSIKYTIIKSIIKSFSMMIGRANKAQVVSRSTSRKVPGASPVLHGRVLRCVLAIVHPGHPPGRFSLLSH